MYAYIYIYIYVCVCMHECMNAYMHTHTQRLDLHVHIYTYLHMYVYTYIHIHVYIYIYGWMGWVYVCICMRACTCLRGGEKAPRIAWSNSHSLPVAQAPGAGKRPGLHALPHISLQPANPDTSLLTFPLSVSTKRLVPFIYSSSVLLFAVLRATIKISKVQSLNLGSRSKVKPGCPLT